MRERCSGQASIDYRKRSRASTPAIVRVRPMGAGALDGGSRQRRGRSRGSALAAVGVSSGSRHADPSSSIERRRLLVAAAAPSSLATPRAATWPIAARHRAASGPARPRRLRRWRVGIVCPSTAAAGRRLRRPRRSGALSREREVRRRARPVGRPRACAIAAAARWSAPPSFLAVAAGGAARRRALARPRPLRRALGESSARADAGRARLAPRSATWCSSMPVGGVHLRRARLAAPALAAGAAPARARRGRAAGAGRRPASRCDARLARTVVGRAAKGLMLHRRRRRSSARAAATCC